MAIKIIMQTMWHPFKKIRKLKAENAALQNELSRLQQEKAILLLQIVHEKAMREKAVQIKEWLIRENHRLIGKNLTSDLLKN
jgi:hypothetical protein